MVTEAFPNETNRLFHPFSGSDVLYAQLFLPDSLKFNPKNAKSNIERRLKDLNIDKNLVPALTLESLIGHWPSGGWNSAMMVERIYKTFENPRVLFVIREQRSMLSSVYRQYFRKGGGRKVEYFLYPLTIKGHGRAP